MEIKIVAIESKTTEISLYCSGTTLVYILQGPSDRKEWSAPPIAVAVMRARESDWPIDPNRLNTEDTR